MQRRLRLLLAIAALPLAAVAAPAKGKPPTVAEAQAFMDKVEAELTALDTEGVHAGWMSQTDINEDTGFAASKARERESLKVNDFVVASRRFDKLALPPALARKFKLLKLNGNPTDPKLVA
jgi:peptidyl-dipeptidase A